MPRLQRPSLSGADKQIARLGVGRQITYRICWAQVLCIQGFLACRKHADRVLLLAEMMAGCGFPCFKAGARTVQQLRRRFHLNLPESQARAHIDCRVVW